jgi:uncharacterized membrane protein YqiK
MTLIITLAVVVLAFVGALSMVLTRFLYICQPNEVLVFSGGQRASAGARSATGSSRAAARCASRCSRRSTRWI